MNVEGPLEDVVFNTIENPTNWAAKEIGLAYKSKAHERLGEGLLEKSYRSATTPINMGPIKQVAIIIGLDLQGREEIGCLSQEPVVECVGQRDTMLNQDPGNLNIMLVNKTNVGTSRHVIHDSPSSP